jgi:hypothetical protein
MVSRCGVNLFDSEKLRSCVLKMSDIWSIFLLNWKQYIHKRMNWLTNENRTKVIEVRWYKLFYLSYKAKNLKMNEKNLKNWYTKIMSRWHLYRRKKLQNRAKDISLLCLFLFFLLIWAVKLLMYKTAKLYRRWAFNGDSDSVGVRVSFRGLLQVSWSEPFI